MGKYIHITFIICISLRHSVCMTIGKYDVHSSYSAYRYIYTIAILHATYTVSNDLTSALALILPVVPKLRIYHSINLL